MVKILIVDDSGLSRKMLRKILESEGHEIIEATGGLIAIEHYFIEQPDLVLLDMLMPDLTGPEVMQKLLEIDKKARIIFATADLQELTRVNLLAAGAVGYITKPFVSAKVIESVNQVLNNSEGVL